MNIDLLIHSTDNTPHEASRKRKYEDDAEEDFDSVFSRRSTSSSISAPSPDTQSHATKSGIEPDFRECIGETDTQESGQCVSFKEYSSSNTRITCCETLFKALSENLKHPINLCSIKFADAGLHSGHGETVDETTRKLVVQKIHDKYVEPLLDLTGYKWVRKEVTPKGRGLKVFSMKYSCSQEVRRRSVSHSISSNTVEEDTCRSRQLSHPLKQFSCESHYSIKYTWSTKTIEVNYRHVAHPPLKRLPEKLKPFILKRLDMRAMDLYQEILISPEFQDIKDLLFFSKVQSYWSKERNKRKVETTKEAFKKFLSK
ncbi:hypothetical protein CLIB1423_29S00254 [[Candida] railenensis]|uniref:Uncharacterized protein n=1 Tax=[Candida] railenensis TaxID=45579 RepID=A0A9P0QWE4_9ASCO|nr:hypothetical protein CLIB1423_29S00254 [[Candida] railenensis]